jgi:hypothetical protein
MNIGLYALMILILLVISFGSKKFATEDVLFVIV